ncbi:MAG: PAS domain-containing hybrid sensor histidine kinase/response regulator, partial [Gammaproteobacteria bacterium]
GRNIRIIMPEPDASQHDDHIQRYLRTGQAHVIGMGIEMQAVRKNGETFPMRLSIAEFSDARPGEKRFIASCHDTTVEKQQEEQLRRSQKMDALGKLTGGIAHDFNNMLSVILGYAELLQQKLETDNNLHRYITEIRTAGNRARKLTSKLLTFSRHQPSDARPTDINNLLKNFQHMLERTLTARIKLQLLLQQNLWLTYIDQELLGDAILNMAINAMHAMPEGGTLSIETRNTSLDYTDTHDLSVSPGEFVTLLITDTGCGMDEKIRAQIFEPFFTTKGELGTGLGMSQVYGFVKQAHGDMRVFSTPGQGSQFRIYIPRYHENARTDIISGYTPTKSTPRGHETILVVDDEASLVDLAKEILNLHEYKVLCADNGKRALEILAQQPVDLLFTDIIMPDINGYMLAKQVEMHYPHTRILMTSGYSDDLHADITNASLHKERLQKPYNAETLLRRVREILDRTA